MSDDDMGHEFPGAPQQVEFWSLEVPPNQTVVAKLSLFPGTMEIAHVTSAALDEKAKPGRHVVKIIPLELDGAPRPEVALGTLELGRTDHFAVDFGFSSNMGFRHTGKSTVFLSGYMTRSYGDVDDEYESGSEEESESESEDDEEAPGLVPLQQNGKVIPVKGPSRAAAAAANGAAAGDSSSEGDDESEEGESDEDDEGEDEDNDMMGDEYDRRLGAKSFGGGDGSSNSGEDDEDDEGEEEGSEGDPLDIDSDDLVAGVQYADVEAEEAGESEDDEDESSDDEGEEEDESEEGEDDSSEEEDEEQQPAATGKRTGVPLTPQPQGQASKKQKGQDGKPVPASAPAKGPVAKTGGAEGAFLSALVSELKKSGSLSLSALATKVKRPEGVSAKFKAFLVQHGDTFKIDGETVSLKK